MIEAFIFDVDGTLIDSNDFHARAWEKAFAEYGKNFSAAQIRPHIGKGADTLLPSFLNHKEIEEIGDAIANRRGEIFDAEFLPQVKPFPRVRELFQKIKADGKRVALASSSNENEVEEYKKIARIEDLVDEATSADDADESKPKPDIFLAALELLGEPPRETVLVVGDAPYDAEAAKKAKLKIVGVLCGGFDNKVLREAGCAAIYNDPADLLKNYQNLISQ